MKKKLIDALKKVIKNFNYPDTDIIIQLPKNLEHGDFSTNIAMILSSKVGDPPIKVANKLINKLIMDFPELINSAKVAGPGFINIYINKQAIVHQLKTILKEGNKFGSNNFGNGKKAQVEFVSANPTGPLTVGHGRGAILGDVIGNILRWNGYRVDREYYYNNAGKQMERLGYSVQARYLNLLGQDIEFPDDGYQGEYISHIAENIKDLKGDSLINTKDIKEFIKYAEENIFQKINLTLNSLNLKFDNFFNENTLFESGAIDKILDMLKQKNLIYEKDGATWFKATQAGREQDRVMIKSTGEPTYRLPDIAYHMNKYNRGYDLIVDVLGADHMDAYPDVIAAINKLGCDTNKMKVIIHQFVTLTENDEPIKMSTRKAQYITLDELINEVGTDVVRYFFIMRSMNSHLNFDLALAKKESDENPVYYLQYAHARICNIIKNATEQNLTIEEDCNLSLLNNTAEITLIKLLLEFPEIIKSSLNSLEPQSIANYLKEISTLFHKYYAKERIITTNLELTKARLLLINAIKIVIYNGLSILGIKAPERM